VGSAQKATWNDIWSIKERGSAEKKQVFCVLNFIYVVFYFYVLNQALSCNILFQYIELSYISVLKLLSSNNSSFYSPFTLYAYCWKFSFRNLIPKLQMAYFLV